jgi:type IV pilus assembly protein PilB
MYSNEDYLIQLLTEAGLVTAQDLNHAKGTKKPTESMMEGLIKSGVVSEEDVARTMAVSCGMEFVDLAGFAPPPVPALPDRSAGLRARSPQGGDHGPEQL